MVLDRNMSPRDKITLPIDFLLEQLGQKQALFISLKSSTIPAPHPTPLDDEAQGYLFPSGCQGDHGLTPYLPTGVVLELVKWVNQPFLTLTQRLAAKPEICFT